MYILSLLIIVTLVYKLFFIENFQINCLYPIVKMNVKDSYFNHYQKVVVIMVMKIQNL